MERAVLAVIEDYAARAAQVAVGNGLEISRYQ